MGAPIITDFNTSPGPDNSTLVQVLGSGFGCDQKSSFLRIGEFVALITYWSETKVEGYVPNTVIKQLSRSHKQLQDIGHYTHDEIDDHIDDTDIHGGTSHVPGIPGNFPSISDNHNLQDSGTSPDTFALRNHSHVGISINFKTQIVNIATDFECNFLLESTPASGSVYVAHNGIELMPGESNDFRIEGGYAKLNNAYIQQVGTYIGDHLMIRYIEGE